MTRAAALILLAALAACGPRTVQPVAAKAPVRIMSMNPCIDAILVQVADRREIVSISHYSQDPGASSIPLDQARRFPVNYDTAEEVVALRPSIVLLSPHVAPATQAAIRKAGIRIESVGVPASIAESREQVLAIARIAGHPERGQALVARIDAALAAAKPGSAAKPISALIRMGGGLVPGAGTLADELLTRTGFRSMSADYGLAMWDVLPLEPLLARPPGLLLTDLSVSRGSPSPLLAKAGVRMADFPERLLQCAGPSLIEAAGRLRAIREQLQHSPLPLAGEGWVRVFSRSEYQMRASGPHALTPASTRVTRLWSTRKREGEESA